MRTLLIPRAFDNRKMPFMPTLSQIQSGSRGVKRQGPRVLAGGAAAVVTVLCIFIGLEVSAAALRATPGSSEQTSDQVVNRARKGDRQIGLHEIRRPQLTLPPDLKLAVGCESLVSALANARLAKVAGRCVS